MTGHQAGFRPRVVATDVDGTIVPLRGTVSEATRRAFRACVRAGIDVVLVTGRPPRWMPPVVAATGIGATAICANGAIVVDTTDYTVLEITSIPHVTLLECVSVLGRLIPDAAFAAESPSVLRAGPGYDDGPPGGDQAEGLVPENRYETIMRTSSTAEMVDAPIYKLVIVSSRLSPDELLDTTREAVGHLASVTRSVTGRALVELGPLGMSKAKALARFCASRGVDAADVVAFGDMPNDIEMLRWAGRGYAMIGSHPDAAAAARFTAPAAENDGVARVLEKMLADNGLPI